MPKRSSRTRYQISDSNLYKMTSKKRLASALFESESSLKELLSQPDLYVRKWKHKKKEEWLNEPPCEAAASQYRAIDIPKPKLKAIQSRIADLLNRISPPDFLFSPVKGRSYVDNASRHRGAKAFWLLDIADYFPSCSANNVARFFGRELKCSRDVTAILVRLTTLNGCLPQGSPCSPILAYFSNGPMWREIARLVDHESCTLSVYADDITISGSVVRQRLIWEIKKVVYRQRMRLKAEKEVSLISAPADITGVVVRGDTLKLPNRQLEKLAELRRERRLARSTKAKATLDTRIAGCIAQRKQIEQAP